MALPFIGSSWDYKFHKERDCVCFIHCCFLSVRHVLETLSGYLLNEHVDGFFVLFNVVKLSRGGVV